MPNKYAWDNRSFAPEPADEREEAYIHGGDWVVNDAPRRPNNFRAHKLDRSAVRIGWPGNHQEVFRYTIREAVERVVEAPQVIESSQHYVGTVKKIEGMYIIAEVGPPDDLDRRIVRIHLGTFDSKPRVDDEIECTVVNAGSLSKVRSRVIDKTQLPSLESLGILREEWLDWASEEENISEDGEV